jgi:beta-lactamase superfamily II metal-dependent hydrolase
MPTTARLEIHQMNVGQGDAILIINRDLRKVQQAISAKNQSLLNGQEPIDWVPLAIANDVSLAGTVTKALLVDGGDDEYGGDVVNYLEAHGVVTKGTAWTPNLVLLVSHFHDDHMAGLRSVFKKRVEEVKFINGKKTTKARLDERYRPGFICHTAPNSKADPATERFAWLIDDIKNAKTAALNPSTVVHLDRGGRLESNPLKPGGGFDPTIINLGTGVDNIPIQFCVFAAAQSVYQGPNAPPVDIPSRVRGFDQNDRSIVMLLEYGSFRYFLGGDIAGNGGADGGNFGANAINTSAKKYFSNHADVESKLAPALAAMLPATTDYSAGSPKFPNAGYCTVVKANHHGSNSSNDVYFLSTVRPLIAVASAGVKKNFHRHPTQEVMNRTSRTQTPDWGLRGSIFETIVNTIEQVYVTECAAKKNKVAFTTDLRGARILGDIVIRPIDETISALQAVTARGQRLTVQVYGTGDRTTIEDADTTLRPVDATATPPYRVGPWTHSDTH